MTAQPSTVNVLDNAPLGDWELVALAQAGGDAGRDAFGALYDRHHEMIYRYIMFRLDHPDRSLAEQMTGEVWLRALRRIQSVRDRHNGEAFGAWVVTIARNLLLDHVKSARHRWDRTVPEIPEPMTRDGLARNNAEYQVLTKLTTEFYARHLTTCLRKLPRDQRDCIGFRFYAGMSVAETAAAMNRNDGAVKALQHRAVRRLAQLLPNDAASWLTGDLGVPA
jgi:RNA polymerase sigma-70 factor (ECF subfamily)